MLTGVKDMHGNEYFPISDIRRQEDGKKERQRISGSARSGSVRCIRGDYRIPAPRHSGRFCSFDLGGNGTGFR